MNVAGVVGDAHASGPCRAVRKRDVLDCSLGLVRTTCGFQALRLGFRV